MTKDFIEETMNAVDRGFSFEGDNDPTTSPKMMFVVHQDGSKSLASPEYFKAFVRHALLSQRASILAEVEGVIHCTECEGTGARSTPSDYSPCRWCDGTGFNISDGSCNDVLTSLKEALSTLK